MSKINQFLKTTAIGGLLFLLPLIVVGALIGKAVPIIQKVAEVLGKFLPEWRPGGISLLLMLAIAIVLLLCFGAGLLARRSLGKQISGHFEKILTMLFPRYAIFKDQMANRVGGDESKPKMKPVLASLGDSLQIGLEIERSESGLATVYLLGAPDPWAGRVVLLSSEHVEPLDIEFRDALTLCEQLGRGSAALKVKPK